MEDDSWPDVIDEDEVLINLVAEKSILYDKSSSQFKDTQKKTEAWNDIASEMCIITESPTEGKMLLNNV